MEPTFRPAHAARWAGILALPLAALLSACAPWMSPARSPAGPAVRAVVAGNPFLQRRAGVFEPEFPAQAARDFGTLKTFLWYADFATDPDGPPNDFTTHERFAELFRQAESRGMVVQLGFEPWFLDGGRWYSLHLETVRDALAVPDLAGQVARIVRALDEGRDPLAALTPRPAVVDAMEARPGGKEAWVSLRMDRNLFLVRAVKWGRFLARRNEAVIVRPLSEMNDDSAGSWCFGRRPENTPKNFAAAWRALVSILRLSGAANAYFALAPEAYPQERLDRERVLAAADAILAADPKAIDAFGVDVYPAADGQHRPVPFATAVQPWVKAYRRFGRPLAVPEMGVNRSVFREDAVRVAWVRDAYRSARRLGFVNVNYFHAGNPPADFTVLPRPGGSAGRGEEDYTALRKGIAMFQAR